MILGLGIFITFTLKINPFYWDHDQSHVKHFIHTQALKHAHHASNQTRSMQKHIHTTANQSNEIKLTHTYQMDNINAHIPSFHTFNSYQQDISRNISRAFVVDNFMSIRILNVNSFTTNHSWF